MRCDEAMALFLLARIEVRGIQEVRNQYWPDAAAYDDVRTPWWRMETIVGPVVIGWRKRVISIDWRGTDVRAVVTTDDVTKTETLVHAWSTAKALEYLTSLGRAIHEYAAKTKPNAGAGVAE